MGAGIEQKNDDESNRNKMKLGHIRGSIEDDKSGTEGESNVAIRENEKPEDNVSHLYSGMQS
jgi:hypothetical protein